MGKNKKKSLSKVSRPISEGVDEPNSVPDVEMDQTTTNTTDDSVQAESDTKPVSLEEEAPILQTPTPTPDAETSKTTDDSPPKTEIVETSDVVSEKQTPESNSETVVELKEIQLEKNEESKPTKSANCSKGWCTIL
jgi:hypothetical protein